MPTIQSLSEEREISQEFVREMLELAGIRSDRKSYTNKEAVWLDRAIELWDTSEISDGEDKAAVLSAQLQEEKKAAKEKEKANIDSRDVVKQQTVSQAIQEGTDLAEIAYKATVVSFTASMKKLMESGEMERLMKQACTGALGGLGKMEDEELEAMVVETVAERIPSNYSLPGTKPQESLPPSTNSTDSSLPEEL